jgi:hypothetical protein
MPFCVTAVFFLDPSNDGFSPGSLQNVKTSSFHLLLDDIYKAIKELPAGVGTFVTVVN